MKKAILVSFASVLVFSTSISAKDLIQQRMDIKDIAELTPYLYKDIENLKSRVSELEAKLSSLGSANVEQVQHYSNPSVSYKITKDTAFSYSKKSNEPKYALNIYSLGEKVLKKGSYPSFNDGWVQIGDNEFIEARFLTRYGD